MSQPSPSNRQNILRSLFTGENAATLFCFLYGIALLINIQPLADGGWYWYALALKSGTHLYADLHLALQPFFILQTEFGLFLFGDSWIGFKVPAIIEMIGYLLALRLISNHLPITSWQRSVLLICAFMLPSLFDAYRFDDYHVPSFCVSAWCIYVLLVMNRGDVTRHLALSFPVLLGFLCGLLIIIRVNDGVLISCAVFCVLLSSVPDRRLITAAQFTAAVALTLVVIVHLTGDTFHDYFNYSVLHAATSKGGNNKVFGAPFLLPLKTIKNLLFHSPYNKLLAAEAAIAASLCWFFLARQRPLLLRIAPCIVIGSIIVATMPSRLLDGEFPVILCGVLVLVVFGTALLVLFRWTQALFSRKSDGWTPLELLLLVPFFQLIADSMSSGGIFIGLYPPVGWFLLLIQISLPISLRKVWLRRSVTSCALFLIFFVLIFKVRQPYSWHTYILSPMFSSRHWYSHAKYGSMYIEDRQLNFAQDVCRQVRSIADPQLLSLPYPYANYFCGIQPWHN